jgi:hypothetical protein
MTDHDCSVFTPESKPIRVISFCLYGLDPVYLRGFEANVELAREHYPEWLVWLWTDRHSVQSEKADRVFCMGESAGSAGMFWRLRAASVSWLDAVIFRDADSRLNACEADAVSEWLESTFTIHSIHAHRHHRIHPLLGGMWGVKGGALPNIGEDMDAWLKGRSGVPSWGWDQEFLKDCVFSGREDQVLHHTSVDIAWPSRPLLVQLPDSRFVGQQHLADGTPVFPR